MSDAVRDATLTEATLRESLRSRKPGERLRFIGELGTYKGQLQFVVHHPSWMPAPP